MNKHEHHESDSFNHLLRETIAGEPLPPADPSLREAILKRLDQPAVRPALSADAANRRRTFFRRAGIALVSTAALALVAVIWQRPNLQVIGWNEPAAVQVAKNPPPKSTSLSTANAQRQPVKDGLANELDDLQLVPAEAFHDRRVAARFGDETRPQVSSDPAPNVTTGTTSSPTSLAPAQKEGNKLTVTTRGARDYFAPGAQASGAGGGQPAEGSGGAAGYGAGKPASGGAIGSDLASAQKAPDSYGNKLAQPAGPEYNVPRGGPTASPESAPATATTKPATPRIIVQEETKERLGLDFESKGGEGQGLPADLKPGEQPASNLYNESAGKNVVDKRLKAIEDRVTVTKTVTKSEIGEQLSREKVRVAEQLASKDATLPKVREIDGEVREKFNKVVALTDELNRARRLSELRPQDEREKLDQLATAIDEVRKVEAKFRYIPQPGGEQYAPIVENQFQSPTIEAHALSTFSIDVDTASYANVRRFLNNGQLPPPDAVRIEELVNYFKYKYPQPKGDDPFSVNMEMADCPWHPGHKLLRVGLQGKEIHRAERPASNLVFLVDTSGSMTDENKLPLLKQAFTMLVGELGENDKVTIVTYAGNAGLRLPPTRGHEKETILAAIDGMQSGGSTHGSAGIALAYEVAAAQFIKGGTNKVILATDGDLNVGITDDSALVELITKKAETGVYLTVLGVGTGNLKDAKMEKLADNGNGIYAYLDSVREARKVLVEEMSGSLVTIAQDVKIQLEFNPAEVESYRLLGYENRVMANKEFRNNAKDAGEIGAGHSVTAMYEVALVGSGSPAVKTEAKPVEEPRLKYQRVAPSEALKYQQAPEAAKLNLTEAAKTGELLTLRLRYKKPEAKKEDDAKELEFPLKNKGGNFNSASQDFQFASAVVAFGLTLRNSEFRGGANLSAVSEIATAVTGEDVGGHRAEFLDLVRRAKTLRGE